MGGVATSRVVMRVAGERAIMRHRRRGRGSMMADLRERVWLAMVMRRHHVCFHTVRLRRGAITIFIIVVIIAPIEIRGAFVFIGTAML